MHVALAAVALVASGAHGGRIALDLKEADNLETSERGTQLGGATNATTRRLSATFGLPFFRRLGKKMTRGNGRARADFARIICPFLSTLVNEGVLEPKASYTEEELKEVTVKAGFMRIIAEAHSRSQFKVLPSNTIDIFDMEGLPNEHLSSTGINDCPTRFYSCGRTACQATTPNKNCGVPNVHQFETFWKLADTNKDGKLVAKELSAVTEGSKGYRGVSVDSNPVSRLQMRSAFGLFVALFGHANNEITKEAARRVLIDRRFPSGHKYPGPTVMPSEFLFSPGGVNAFIDAFNPFR